MVSDNVPDLSSSVLKYALAKARVKAKLAAPYRRQSQNRAEHVVQTVESALTRIAILSKKDWEWKLGAMEKGYWTCRCKADFSAFSICQTSNQLSVGDIPTQLHEEAKITESGRAGNVKHQAVELPAVEGHDADRLTKVLGNVGTHTDLGTQC